MCAQRAGDLARPGKGLTVAGQRRNLTGFPRRSLAEAKDPVRYSVVTSARVARGAAAVKWRGLVARLDGR